MVEKYHICSVQTLNTCVERYVSQENLLSLQNKNYEGLANRSKDDRIMELKAALRKTQKEAELEKLRTKAYDKMIDLAEQIGKDPATISQWCTNTSLPDLATLLQVAKLLEVDVKDLFNSSREEEFKIRRV